MTIFRCKMCGGDLKITEGQSVCTCEFCGTKQTLPKIDDDKLMKLYDRANRLRMSNEFDKATNVYESIIAESDTEAEAYWGLLLCKFGIEYVDDPTTGDKIPTCHRSSFESIMDDSDFEMVMENADGIARNVYREQAKQIEEIRKSIIEVSGKEAPYDIFVCYKESNEDGERTIDSVMAQDVYDQLVAKGYRVFFSRITLEDKLGQEYEPYIFAALNSAKIMLVFGTDYNYYNAVWVKNEWSRYLKLMTKDKEKHLIPCYKDIDAYDIPKEFKHLQAQDMGKVGAVQDLIRGIDKILNKNRKMNDAKIKSLEASSDSLIKRVCLLLEEHKWNQALKICDQILNADPENGEVYWLKELAEKNCENVEELVRHYYYSNELESKTISNAKKYANSKTKEIISEFEKKLANEENRRLEFLEKKRIEIEKDEDIRKVKEKIENSRRIGELLENKVLTEWSNISICVNTNGEVLITEIPEGYHDCYRWLKKVEEWTNIYKIYGDHDFVIGLKYDGKLLFACSDVYKEEHEFISIMEKWQDIIQIYIGYTGCYGLTKAGKVLFARKTDEYAHGEEGVCEFEGVCKIISDMGPGPVVCLNTDGTLNLTKSTKKRSSKRWDIFIKEMSKWTDIVDIYALSDTSNEIKRVIGIKKNGTLVATSCITSEKSEADEWIEMSNWINVVKITYFMNQIIALDAYGNLLTTTCFQDSDYDYEYAWDNISEWNGLVDIVTNCSYAVGLIYDGSVVAKQWGTNWTSDHGGPGDEKVWKDVKAMKISDNSNSVLCVKTDGTIYRREGYISQEKMVELTTLKLFENVENIESDINKNKKKGAYEAYIASVSEKMNEEIEPAIEMIRSKYDVIKQPVITEMNQILDTYTKRRIELDSTWRMLKDRLSGVAFYKVKEKADISKQMFDIECEIAKIETNQAVKDRYQPRISEISKKEEMEIQRIKDSVSSKYHIISIDEFEIGDSAK